MAEIKKTVAEMFAEVADFLTDCDAPEEMINFIEGRKDQVVRGAEKAKEARLKKTGGVKKDVAQADFYVGLRDKLYPVLSTEVMTGDELLAKIENVTPNGKAYLAAQVAVALKPFIADGTVVVSSKKVEYINKKGLKQESLRNGYALA